MLFHLQNLYVSFTQKIKNPYIIISSAEEGCYTWLTVQDYQFEKSKCNNWFHKECVDKQFIKPPSCPLCSSVVGQIILYKLFVINSDH